MTKVSFKKVPAGHIKVLRGVVELYGSSFELQLANTADTEPYLEALLTTDIATRVYMVLRAKVEADKPAHTFSLKRHEAIVLHNACNHALALGTYNVYSFNAARDCRDNIDEQLKSIVPRLKNPINLLH